MFRWWQINICNVGVLPFKLYQVVKFFKVILCFILFFRTNVSIIPESSNMTSFNKTNWVIMSLSAKQYFKSIILLVVNYIGMVFVWHIIFHIDWEIQVIFFWHISFDNLYALFVSTFNWSHSSACSSWIDLDYISHFEITEVCINKTDYI